MIRKKLSNVDLAWLRLDHPENQMVITGMMTIGESIEFEQLKARLIDSLKPFQRFQQILVTPQKPFQRAYWEEYLQFDFSDHITVLTLPGSQDQQVLQETISKMLSTRLDPGKPLWQIYYIPSYQGGSAIIARIHHTITDGISLMQIILLALDKDATEGTLADGMQSRLRARPRRHQRFTTWKKARHFIFHPRILLRKLKKGFLFLLNIVQIVFLPADPPTPFKGPLGIAKRAVWSHPIDMKPLRITARQTGSTVNDLITSVIVGTLRRYLIMSGKSTSNLSIRAFVIANLRPLELNLDLGNHFGFYILDIPLWIEDAQERILKIKQGMDELKTSPTGLATYVIFWILGSLPTSVEKALMRFFDRKGSLVITNIPGYRRQLYLSGVPITTMSTIVPHTSRIGLGFSIVSYNETAIVGISSDEGLIPKPELLMDFFYDELNSIIKISGGLVSDPSPKDPPVT